MDDEEKDYGKSGGECAAALRDYDEAMKAGDYDTAAIAFKQAVHCVDDDAGEPEGDEPKGGILAILGKPKKG